MLYRFDVLGPLQVARDGESISLGSVKQRLVLASLLFRPNELIATGELVASLWDDPPASATANLRTYVRGLRRALDTRPYQRLPVASGGYLLRLETGERDLDRFEAAASRGRAALTDGDLARAEEELAAATAAWRGAVLAGLPLPPSLQSRAARWEELRLLVEEDYAEVKLAAGAPGEVIPRMRALLDQHPLRQRAWGHLMAALYLSGDVAGALSAFRQARQLLAQHTGLDPSPDLSRLHDDILHHRPVRIGRTNPPVIDSSSAEVDPPSGTVVARPEQLPMAVPDFVGREAELAHLDACLEAQTDRPTTVIISAVSGMAGVGKTALALRWAHRVTGRFPDGQLYVNLRGYDEDDAVSPADVLRGFLEALGVPPPRIPADLDARIGLYRSLLTSRRVLVVLDNARDCDQVRPLLPGAGRAVVVVTSRDQLNGLVAAECAKPLTLSVLTDAESISLLCRRVGGDRIAADPAATHSIIRATGRLPLALSIVAARAATRPTFPLGAFAAELNPSEARLDALADGDIRRVFSWSYRALSEPAAKLFRRLGLHPGPDLTSEAAAALLGAAPTAVTPLLRELTRRHMLTEHAPGRYTFHDLLRAYAAELVRASEPAPLRHAAHNRLYDYYLHTAYPVAVLLQPQWTRIEPLPRLPTNASAPPTDHAAALAWLAAEQRVLQRVLRQAAESGFETYAWQLAWALTTYLAPRGLWHAQSAAQQIALTAAEKVGDPSGQATANRLLARAATHLGQHDVAEHRLQCALALYEDLGSLADQAQTLHNYTELCFRLGRTEEALCHGREALRRYRMAGSRSGEGRALNAIGYLHAVRGEYDRAIRRCTAALTQQRRIKDRNGQAATLDSLGFIHQQLGDYGKAASYYEESVALFRASADRYHEAETLVRLGQTWQAMGDQTAAAAAWRQAVAIYDDLGDPAADGARAHLGA